MELAYALLTTCFYQHNEKMLAKAEKRAERPILAYQQVLGSSCLTAEKFGLTFPQTETGRPESSSQSISPLQLKTSSYDAIKERILSSSYSILRYSALLTDEGLLDEISDDISSDDDSVSLEWAKTVLLQALISTVSHLPALFFFCLHSRTNIVTSEGAVGYLISHHGLSDTSYLSMGSWIQCSGWNKSIAVDCSMIVIRHSYTLFHHTELKVWELLPQCC